MFKQYHWLLCGVFLSLLGCSESEWNGFFTSDKRKEAKIVDPATSTDLTLTSNAGTLQRIQFSEPIEIDTEANPLTIATHDLNQDGFKDLLVLHPVTEGRRNLENDGILSIFMRQPTTDVLYEPAQTSFFPNARRQHLLVNDFNGDSVPDVLLANIIENGARGSLTWLQGQSANIHASKDNLGIPLSFVEIEGAGLPESDFVRTTEMGEFPLFMIQEDWNRDGFVDVGVIDRVQDSITILFNRTDGDDLSIAAFGAVSPVSNDDQLDAGHCLEVSTVADDGTSDFLVFNEHCGGREPLMLTSGDWNGDCYADLAVLDLDDREVSILLNIPRAGTEPKAVECSAGETVVAGNSAVPSTRTFEKIKGADGNLVPDLTVGKAPRFLTSGDWDADGNQDLAVTSQRDEIIILFYGDGTGHFTRQEEGVELGPRQLVSTDFNGDGIADFVAGNVASVDRGDLTIMLSEGPRNYVHGRIAMTTRLEGDRPGGLTLDDVNGDGKQDILVSHPFRRKVVILLQQ